MRNLYLLLLSVLLFSLAVSPARLAAQQGSSSNAISTQQDKNSLSQQNDSTSSTEISAALTQLLSAQTSDLKSLKQQWDQVRELSMQLSNDNRELKGYLQNSLETITNLENNLEVAKDRINDAEGGAISLLDENTKLYETTKSQEVKIANLGKKNAEKIILIIILSGIIAAYIALRVLKFLPQTKAAFFWVP